jgi:hypothetical protein
VWRGCVEPRADLLAAGQGHRCHLGEREGGTV